MPGGMGYQKREVFWTSEEAKEMRPQASKRRSRSKKEGQLRPGGMGNKKRKVPCPRPRKPYFQGKWMFLRNELKKFGGIKNFSAIPDFKTRARGMN